MCGGVRGEGGYSPPFFIYRSPREEDYVALWPLPTHAGARKIIISMSIITDMYAHNNYYWFIWKHACTVFNISGCMLLS